MGVFSEGVREAAVATVFNTTGSMPRQDGAQMLIAESGATADTIGGGKMDSDVVRSRKRS